MCRWEYVHWETVQLSFTSRFTVEQSDKLSGYYWFDRGINLKLWFLKVIVLKAWAMNILPCLASTVYYYFWKVAYLVYAILNTTCLQLNSVKSFHSSHLISFFKLVKSIPLLRCINFPQINVVVSQLTLQLSAPNKRTNMILI